MTQHGRSQNYFPSDRRPIASRETRWATWMTEKLVGLGFSPNAISIGGMFAAVTAGACFAATTWADGAQQRPLWLCGAILCQVRLLCNLFDGMVAIRQGVASPVGELFNEVPDRVSDSAVMIGLGFACGGDWQLGYLSALLAVSTAYIRVLGKSLGLASDFIGPMAKPQRMALVTALAVYLGLSPWKGGMLVTEVAFAQWLICLGCLATILRRISRLSRRLRNAGG
jgi:phosphatidylglycerophosphate synthase